MSVMSWNCQGAGSTEAVQRLREIRRESFPDFLFLFETKQQNSYMSDLQQSLGYEKMVTVEPLGLSGGLAVLWKNSFQVDVLFADKRIIDLQIKMGSMVFFLSCVYGDPVRARRQDVWEKLISFSSIRDAPWLLVGDFNELMDNSEKLGGPERGDATFWNFRNMASNCKIRELPSSGVIYSWAGWRDQVWVQCRLDRSFGNDEWFSLFPQAHMEYLNLWGSDHRPILMRFSHDPEQLQKGRFYFDARMLNKEGVAEAITRGWCNTPNDDTPISTRIRRCRTELARWKRTNTCNSKTLIEKLKLELESECVKQFPCASRMQHLKRSLAEAYRDEEIFWRQKSREQWLKEGDKNSKYFHNAVKGRKIKNRILMLKDDNGCEHFSEGSKGAIAVEYFRSLFRSLNPRETATLLQNLEPKITSDMNTMLTAPVLEEEIRQAVFSLKSQSAPGVDGLTGSFYQKFWHIVGPSLVREIQQFFVSAVMPHEWNHTQICLLPKVSNPTLMTELRPISLCSVHYKIISKILCSRLKGCLPEIVSDTQGAFVTGRLISDNIIIVHEMIHSLRTCSTISKEFMAIKTDMSKAYDRVEWSFLSALMVKMGFSPVWVNWIVACISSVSYTVLLNGRSHGFIKPDRGLRQGDPLSPFLFIICAEALVNKLNQSEASQKLTGIRFSTVGPSVHHLLFADDSLLLCKATALEATEIKHCLCLYGQASGQVINPSKSSIIFGTNVPTVCKEVIKRILEIDKEGGEGTYLGLPECFSGSKRKLLNFIQEKLQSRLHGWYAQALSQGGKEILLKSIGLALPVYAMSCFRLSKDLCKKLTSASAAILLRVATNSWIKSPT